MLLPLLVPPDVEVSEESTAGRCGTLVPELPLVVPDMPLFPVLPLAKPLVLPLVEPLVFVFVLPRADVKLRCKHRTTRAA